MREYETVIVLDATLDETRVDEEIETVGKVIADGGGEVLDVQRWGRRRLAYEVRKKREGVYSLIRYKSEATVLDELERRFSLNESMLRHLTVISRGPSVVPGLEERDRDEGRRGGPDGGRRRDGDLGRPHGSSATRKPTEEKPAEEKPAAADGGSTEVAAEAESRAASPTETVAGATTAAAAATDETGTEAAATEAAATDAAATDAAATDAAATDAVGEAAPDGGKEPPATDADAATGEQDAGAPDEKTQD